MSNLGPLLFLLYTNDFPNCLDTSVSALFADDTNLTVSGDTSHDIEIKLEKDLSIVQNWLLANILTLNVNEQWMYASPAAETRLTKKEIGLLRRSKHLV